MRGHYWAGIVLALLCVIVWLLCVIYAGDIDHVSDRICVPLYDETGLECCQ
jgi:hypothetical protein